MRACAIAAVNRVRKPPEAVPDSPSGVSAFLIASLSGVCGVLVLAAVVIGIYAMVHQRKSSSSKSQRAAVDDQAGAPPRAGSVDRVSIEKVAGSSKILRVPCLQNPDHDELAAHIESQKFVWVNYEDPTDADLEKLSELVKLHPLTLQDARMFGQRPKIEDYDGYMFIVAFGVDSGAESGGPLLREVHMIVSGDHVITIHKRPFGALTQVRARYNDQAVRSEQFLVYKILDAITSTFVPVLSRVDDDIDDLEQQVIDNATKENLQQIFSLKRDLIAMRRVVTPMRDMFARNADLISELPGLDTDDRLYFRDLYDGLIRVSDLVDSYRDLLSGATDMYLSTVANRQGEINKQLTVIATIFLPLTFLTGFFGQNFAFLTGHILDTTWSFFVLGLGSMVSAAIGFAIYFRRKRWT